MSHDLQAILDRINEIVETTNTTDFRLESFIGDSLLLIGSFDLSYYHQLEVRFDGVSFIGLPIDGIDSPKFSVAAKEERKAHSHLDLDADDVLFRVHHDPNFNGGTVYYVAAKRLSISEGMVYHYQRNNLKEGERIADWVKESG